MPVIREVKQVLHKATVYFFATEPTNPYLLDHDADTEPSSSGSPVVVAEELHRNGNDDPTTELAVIAVHTQDSSKRPSNIATLLTPLVNMLK